MRIKRFQIKNYKGFWDTDLVELSSRFNVIVGRNDAGKSALVEALSIQYDSKPHRSLKNLQTIYDQPDTVSSIFIDYELTGQEIGFLFAQQQEFCIPDNGQDQKTTVEVFASTVAAGGTLKVKWVNQAP